MSDLENTTAEATEDVSTGGEVEAPTQEQPTSGGNPAWDGIRSELGDVGFSRIEKYLKDFDSNHNRQIQKLNEKYSWAKELEGSGLSADQVKAAVNLSRSIDEAPEQIYERLGQFLREQGRMPDSAAELEANTDDPEGAEEEVDPRIAELQAQQEQMRQFLQAQEQERISREADQALDSELDALKKAHPEFSKEDIGEVLQRAILKAQLTGKEVTLEEATAEYIEVRNRILSTPRPGDSAPRLVPTSGGNAAVANSRSYGDLTRGETQSLIASLVAQDQARQ